jgi:hypothetical protein
MGASWVCPVSYALADQVKSAAHHVCSDRGQRSTQSFRWLGICCRLCHWSSCSVSGTSCRHRSTSTSLVCEQQPLTHAGRHPLSTTLFPAVVAAFWPHPRMVTLARDNCQTVMHNHAMANPPAGAVCRQQPLQQHLQTPCLQPDD